MHLPKCGENLHTHRVTGRPEAFSEMNFRALFDHAPDGILVVNSRGLIEDANPRAEELFGYTVEELRDSAVEVLVPDESRGRHVENRDRYWREPMTRSMGMGMELAARRKDGTQFPVEISLSTMQTESGMVTLATVRDMTHRKRLRDFGAAALRAAEGVRMEIARDLHDDTAQQLSAHLIHLRLLENAASEETRKEQVELLREGLQETVATVRRIARGLRPPELEDAGLKAAIQAHARILRESRGLPIEVDVEPVEPALDSDGLLVLYRIIQEALTNVARHADASQARVRLRREGGMVVAEVLDDGVGFPAQRTLVDGHGLGLMGMQERAAMVGGDLTVDSVSGQGTTVSVRIPVQIEREMERV